MATAIVWPFVRVLDMENGTLTNVSQEDQALLSLLAQGHTDEVVAQRLGLTRRTYRRRLSSVMDRLGARSRFQAGVHAALRGWIPNAGGSFGHDTCEEQARSRRIQDDAHSRKGARNG